MTFTDYLLTVGLGHVITILVAIIGWSLAFKQVNKNYRLELSVKILEDLTNYTNDLLSVIDRLKDAALGINNFRRSYTSYHDSILNELIDDFIGEVRTYRAEIYNLDRYLLSRNVTLGKLFFELSNIKSKMQIKYNVKMLTQRLSILKSYRELREINPRIADLNSLGFNIEEALKFVQDAVDEIEQIRLDVRQFQNIIQEKLIGKLIK